MANGGSGLNALPRNVQILVVVSLMAGIGVIVLDEFRGSGSYSTAVNTSIADGITGIGELTSWLDIIALIIAASIILYFVFKGIRSGQGGGGY